MHPGTIFWRDPEFILTGMDGERKAVAETSGTVIQVNEVGEFLLELLEEKRTLDWLVAETLRQFEVTAEAVTPSIEQFLEKGCAEGIVHKKAPVFH